MQHNSHPTDLHQRYQTQAVWTAAIRTRLYDLAEIRDSSHVLEIGSGSGVIIGEIARRFGSRTFGIDIDPIMTHFARSIDKLTAYTLGDGCSIPYPDGIFNLTLCHFLLMWVSDPTKVLDEMIRVTQPGGWVMALAEPDYGGRIDYPKELSELGKLQADALVSQGSDPQLGRKLRALFSQSRLEDVHAGVLGGEWSTPSEEELESEWQTLTHDLKQSHASTTLDAFRELDRQARLDGTRILYVPMFYAHGRVKS